MYNSSEFLQAAKKPWTATAAAPDLVRSRAAAPTPQEIVVPLRPLKIAWVCSWTDPATLLQTHILHYSEDGQGHWSCPKHLSFLQIVPLTEAEYVIVLDDLPANFQRRPGQKLVYIQREPPVIRSLPDLSQYYAACTLDTVGYHASTPWIKKSFHSLLHMDWPVKTKTLVAVCSGKTFTPDHRWRLELLKALCQTDIDIDVYGRGLRPEDFHGHYRGSTSDNDKSELLKPYRFCLAMENSSEPGYFTEKLVDPLLMFCVPIYSGCPNVSDFFPERSCFLLNKDHGIPKLVHTIQSLVGGCVPLETQLDVAEARRRILLQYGVWPTVHNLLCCKK